MTLTEIKENNLRCVIKVDSREEAVKLFEIFNPNGYDVNYAYGYLRVNYWKGDGTVCFGVAGNKIDGFDTETYYKKNEEQYGKIYRFKDLIAKEGIVGTFKGTPVYADSRTLSMADGTIIGDFSTGGFCDGFRFGKIPNDLIVSHREMERARDRLLKALEKPSVKFGIKELEQELKEEKNLKFTFYVKEGTRPDKKCNGLIPTMTTTVVDASGKKATVTCDKADYSERQGVLEAIAQMACGGNFDKEYDKAVKKNKLIELHDRTCTYCGKVFDTVEERKAEEAWHVERKKARRERYLLRKRAKEIAFEEQAQKMAKEMMGEQK